MNIDAYVTIYTYTHAFTYTVIYLLNYKSKSFIRNSYFLSYHAKGYNFTVKYGHKFMCY